MQHCHVCHLVELLQQIPFCMLGRSQLLTLVTVVTDLLYHHISVYTFENKQWMMSSSTGFSDLMLQSLNGYQICCLNHCLAKMTQDNVKLILNRRVSRSVLTSGIDLSRKFLGGHNTRFHGVLRQCIAYFRLATAAWCLSNQLFNACCWVFKTRQKTVHFLHGIFVLL